MLADDPLLTVRLPGMERALAGPGRARCAAAAAAATSRLVRPAREMPVWVIADRGRADRAGECLARRGVEVMRVPVRTDGRLDLAEALKAARRCAASRALMVEGGPTRRRRLVSAPIWSTRSSCSPAPDALDRRRRRRCAGGRPLAAMLATPRICIAAGSEQIGDDRSEYFERTC